MELTSFEAIIGALAEHDNVQRAFTALVGLATLIRMKQAAGRAIDLDDVRQLQLLQSDEPRDREPETGQP